MKNSASIQKVVSISLFIILFSFENCSKSDPSPSTSGTYSGTGSVTKGKGTTTSVNFFTCSGGRPTSLGTISSSDGKSWIVPAPVDFATTSFPFASDLNNTCTNHNYTSEAQALAAISGTTDVVVIDTDGDVVTGYIFADNYFEMYVNGIAVGKDPVPYTPFNSCIVRFKVKKPYTVAMKLVDWEENLGVASENNNGQAYYPGDGGMVAVFKRNGVIEGITGSSWKAQTFYTGPISDLSCLTESGTSRLSSGCSTTGVADGSSFSAVHWDLPSTWFAKTYDDSSWPSATVYQNGTVGIDNKTSYTNFTDIFDNSTSDAKFIWSSNLILDNLVIVRGTIQ